MRYRNVPVVINNSEQWEKFINDKGLNRIRQYVTPRLEHPTSDEIIGIQEERKIWSTGDRLWKISQEYYNDPKLWWVIAWWNQKPTESHFKNGDLCLIPTPLSEVLRLLEV